MPQIKEIDEIVYPRRRVIRAVLQRVAEAAFFVLTDFHLVGKENFPKEGPLLVVGNHFSFVDPVAMIRAVPWPVEFVGGFRMPNAPPSVTWLPKVWGYYPVFRGTGARGALLAAEAVLKQDGILGIFPEATSAVAMLRPARPGAAWLADRTGARILPLGLEGFPDIFPKLRQGQRARVTVRVGKPFGPFSAPGRGRARRRRLDEIGHEIMRRIAELIPPERRGYYSEDPAIRKAAEEVEYNPYEAL